MMYYIRAASTISHQPTFDKPGFSKSLRPLSGDSDIIHPEYKSYISPLKARRMSKMLKMAVTCSLRNHKATEEIQAESIVMGTGLGCLTDTEKFMYNINTLEDLIPPTSFIQSTHNTVAGQISLLMKNHCYNMTHSQNSLSFEHALSDGILGLDEGKSNVMIGAADEKIDFMDRLADELGYDDLNMTTGASVFTVSSSADKAKAGIRKVAAHTLFNNLNNTILAFLEEEKLSTSAIDLVLYASGSKSNEQELNELFSEVHTRDYIPLCGHYFTNSAFAMHYGTDLMEHEKNINRVLICNNIKANNLGLILLESVEA